MTHPAIFLDRDGVINCNRSDYVKSWDEFEFLPTSLDALRTLSGLGWPIVIITNQSAIGRGLLRQQVLDEIHARMLQAIEQAGGRIARVFYCPHHPDDGCTCRKPAPGLLVQAAQEMGIDLTESILVGDGEADILLALRAGCRPILVLTGRGLDQQRRLAEKQITDYLLADDLAQAALLIVAQAHRKGFEKPNVRK